MLLFVLTVINRPGANVVYQKGHMKKSPSQSESHAQQLTFVSCLLFYNSQDKLYYSTFHAGYSIHVDIGRYIMFGYETTCKLNIKRYQ